MFKRVFQLLLITFLATGALWAADDPFVGQWKLNPSRSKIADVMKVSHVDANKYAFDLGAGNETIVTDGTDQPGYSGTTLSVTVEGPNRASFRGNDEGKAVALVRTNLEH